MLSSVLLVLLGCVACTVFVLLTIGARSIGSVGIFGFFCCCCPCFKGHLAEVSCRLGFDVELVVLFCSISSQSSARAVSLRRLVLKGRERAHI